MDGAEGLEVLRKFGFFVLFLFASISLFADSFRFSIVWDNVVTSESNLSVIGYTDDYELSTKALEQTYETQNVARIKYSSNEGGDHTLVYKATPLMSDSDASGYGFIIYFNHPVVNPSSRSWIVVGKNKNVTYPTGTLEGSAMTVLDMGDSGDMNTQYVGIQVMLTDLDDMRQGINYRSTITIERQAI